MSVLDHAHIVHLNEVFDEEVADSAVFVSAFQRSSRDRNINDWQKDILDGLETAENFSFERRIQTLQGFCKCW